MKRIRYILEGILLHILCLIFKSLGPENASHFGGFLGRTLGPLLRKSHKTALSNLQMVYPDKSQEDIANIVTGMWENLGRVLGEYPHLYYFATQKTTFYGSENLQPLRGGQKPAIIYGAHLGNWEIPAVMLTQKENFNIGAVYRAPNNPVSDRLLHKFRTLNGQIQTFSKSRDGMRNLLVALKNGTPTGILIDQKYNEGVAHPFFGGPVMVSTAFIDLAKKFDCPLLPARVVRVNKTEFQFYLYHPLNTQNQDQKTLLSQAHEHLEEWINETPEQWIWLHRRWNQKALDIWNKNKAI